MRLSKTQKEAKAMIFNLPVIYDDISDKVDKFLTFTLYIVVILLSLGFVAGVGWMWNMIGGSL